MAFLTHSHMVPLPGWFLALRIVQLILAVGIIGINGYLASLAPLAGFCLALFTGAATLIIIIYYLVSNLNAPTAYNKWAVLGLEIFEVVFWVSTMGVLAWYASVVDTALDYTYSYDSSDCDGYYYCYKMKRSLVKRDTTYDVAKGLVDGATAMAALEFALFCVSLIFFSVFLHRHRTSTTEWNGKHSGPEKTQNGATVNGQVEGFNNA